MVGLSTDQAAQVQNNTLSLVSLSENCDIGVLESSKFLLVALSFPLKFLSNLLLQNQSLESIITLLLSSRKARSEAGRIILLLINETSKTSVFTLVVLNLDLKVLSLLGKLLGESLEFEEL